MLAQLNTYELQALMAHDPQFIGVFALDELPHNLPMDKTIKLIVNLQPKSQPGSHWVAIYRRGNNGFYFDTFGRLPPSTIRNWLANNTRRWKFYDKIIQAPSDKVSCGYICLTFLKRL